MADARPGFEPRHWIAVRLISRNASPLSWISQLQSATVLWLGLRVNVSVAADLSEHISSVILEIDPSANPCDGDTLHGAVRE